MPASLNLNGLWKFCPAFGYLVGDQRWTDTNYEIAVQNENKPESGADMGWINPGYDDSGWLNHPVPGDWGTTFEDLWSYEGHGWFRREILVPADWEGKRVLFHSEGANYFTKVYVNGSFAGDHEGGYTSFGIDISEFVKCGEQNTIAVSIDNESSPDRCPGGQAGWWNYGGMYRDVELRVTDTVWFDDVTVVTDVHPDDGTADVSVSVVAGRVAGDTTPRTIELELTDSAGASIDVETVPVELCDDCMTCGFTVKDARFWSPEHPNLYTVTLRMRSENGPGEVWTHRIGLRTVTVDGTRLLLNGEPMLLKGINRHELYPNRGRTHTEAELTRDLDLCDWMGCNALRCHYPNHRRHYELCDERGILNYTEVPLWQWGRTMVETAGPGALGAAKKQLEEMIKTLKNHPSIFLWSVSNENHVMAGNPHHGGPEIVKMVVDGNYELVDMAHSLDATRPVVESSNMWPGDPVHEVTDVTAVNVYVETSGPRSKNIDTVRREMHKEMSGLREQIPDRPIIMSEFGTWTTYGLKTDYFPGEKFQSAKLRAMWEQALEEENVVGCFIWVFSDAEVHKRFKWVYEYNVAYGLFDKQRRPKEAAYTMRELWKGIPRDPVTET
jgi:beta-glucuronidase